MVTCLVTIHGIGFQQLPEPEKNITGYADALHQHLLEYLGENLGGDTDPQGGRMSDAGPIYVSSHWPPDAQSSEPGVARLGKWKLNEKKHREINIEGASIIDRGRPISHIALVYSRLQDQGPHFGASVETIAKALFSSGSYLTFGGATHAIFQSGIDAVGGWLKPAPQNDNLTEEPSLKVRDNPGKIKPQDRDNFLTVIRQLEQDVATYICRNDLRERVRSFVYEALVRLCYRPDVDKVIINAHSQGTVLAFDILRQLPPMAMDKVAVFVTAGSPLRKYADLFYWGENASCISSTQWINFWDQKDPVADPLVPDKSWRYGDPVPEPTSEYSDLFQAFDPENSSPIKVPLRDIAVDNANHGAGGGLAAHNYWDNKPEFIDKLNGFMRKAANLPNP